MQELNELKNKLAAERPAPFEALPDIELYKDQVLTYMQRQHVLEGDEETLTGAMINNYIKSGLLPRPQGKRYDRQHLAYLTAICQLKQLLSVSQVDALLRAQPDLADTGTFYNRYCAALDAALKDTADRISGDTTPQDIAQKALELSLCAYAQRLAAQQLLALLSPEEKPEKKPSKPQEK